MTYANGTADPVGLDATRFETRIGHEGYVRRLPERVTRTITASKLEVTDRFREVVDLFGEDHQETPAGFRIEMATHGSVTSVDLVRDIGYERGGTPRPTPLLFSADSANPYEVSDCAPLIANVTCNPGIVYDLFINNPDANIGGHFTTLDEVLDGAAIAVYKNDTKTEIKTHVALEHVAWLLGQSGAMRGAALTKVDSWK